VAVRVILPRSLVSLIPGTERTSEVEASSVREAIDRLDARTPGLRNRLVDSGPVLREHINVFVDGDQATLETRLRPDSTVHVIPAVSGGGPQRA
jgi:molybdopterin converting factor small subunit